MFVIPAPGTRGGTVDLQLSLAVKQEFFDERAPMLYQQLSNSQEFLMQIAHAISEIPEIYRVFLPAKEDERTLVKLKKRMRKSIANHLAEGVSTFRRLQIPTPEPPSGKIFIFGDTRAGKKQVLQILQDSTHAKTTPNLPDLLYSISVGETGVLTYDCLISVPDGSCIDCSNIIGCITGVHGLVAVFDQSSVDDLTVAKDHFWQVLANPLMQGVPILILLHTNYQPPPITTQEFPDFLQLENVTGSYWKVFETTTERPETIIEAFRWLIRQII
jgi:hypothetical protein